MVRTGILNPQINSLLSRVRHTNTLLITDRGFPHSPTIETVDLSLVDDIPRVLDVLRAIRLNFTIGQVTMAEEFRCNNSASVVNEFAQALSDLEILYEPHVAFKKRIPDVIGIIRTGDTIQYANMILESS